MEDITYIRDQIGFDKLPEGLRDVALRVWRIRKQL